METAVSTKYWHDLKNGKIQCDLCPRHCQLKEGQRGFCVIRERQNNEVVLTAYGKASGFAVDPIEKKPLNHFLPTSQVLSFGTLGCNLGCQFCQNWHLSRAKEMEILNTTATPKQIAQAAREKNCKSVAFTYNEPIISFEYSVDTAKACHDLGLKTVAVTNGYICDEPRKEFFAHMDAANVDLKSFNKQFYKKITLSEIGPVLDTLIYLKKHTNVWFEIATLLIPTLNDSDEELDQMSDWMAENIGFDVPWHFSAFFPACKMMNFPPTPLETLQRARTMAMKKGLYYVYTGNAHDIEGASTYCHHCKKRIIERHAFIVTDYQLTKDGRCAFCNTQCHGVFDSQSVDHQQNPQPIP